MAVFSSTSSTTVDLSQLAVPVLVEQLSFETILAAMVADVQARLPSFDATVDSDPAVKVLQVAAYRELLIRRAFQDGASQLLVAYATGPALDHLGALVGVPRLVVTPADPLTGAAAILEADDVFRQRIVLAPESFTSAGPELAYVFHAKAASADVLDASATSPAAGEVVVAILAAAGDGTAPPALVDAVAARVTDPGIRPLGDDVRVIAATIVPFTVAASLVILPGPDIALVIATARASLAAFLAANRKLGRDITRSGITAALTVPGVHRVDIAQPVEDVACDPTEAGWCTDVALAFAGYAA